MKTVISTVIMCIATLMLMGCGKAGTSSESASDSGSINNIGKTENYEKYVDALYNTWRNFNRDEDFFSEEELYDRAFSDNLKAEFERRNIKPNNKPIFSKSLADMEDKFMFMDTNHVNDTGDFLVDGNSWFYGTDYGDIDFKILSVNKVDSNPDKIKITVSYSNMGGESIERYFIMIEEDGYIVVDDFDGEKDMIRKYMRELPQYLKGYSRSTAKEDKTMFDN